MTVVDHGNVSADGLVPVIVVVTLDSPAFGIQHPGSHLVVHSREARGAEGEGAGG